MRPGDHSELRILHWNIHSWRTSGGEPNTDAVTALISELAPDAVSLVEADEPWGRPRCLREVADRAGYTWVFIPALTFGEAAPAGGFGNALLIRRGLAILGVQQWDLLWPPRVYDGTEPSESRTVLLTELDTGACRIWVGTTHLPRSDKAARDDALERLTTMTGTLGDAWLICGDFNTPAAAWVPAIMNCAPAPAAPTYPADKPADAIDYAIASRLVNIQAEVILSPASDHMPICVKARFTSSRPTTTQVAATAITGAGSSREISRRMKQRGSGDMAGQEPIGTRVAAIRKMRGWTAQELARRASVSYQPADQGGVGGRPG